MTTPRAGRVRMRRAIVIVPSAFTAGNLFFGVWALVETTRGNFGRAAWLIVFAAVLDLLDGSIARMSRTGTPFGAELDSLVDVVSFGVAPAFLFYHLQLRGSEWGWLLAYTYVLAAALRLARFNIEQAGLAKTQFVGLPSPVAGVTLATYYPFSETPFFAQHLASWPWPLLLVIIVIMLSLLMVSLVPYPVLPRVGLRSWRGRAGLAVNLAVLYFAVKWPAYFFFPTAVAYVSLGLSRAVFFGFLDRLPERDLLRDEEEEARERQIRYEVPPSRFRLRLGRRRRAGPGPGGP